MHAQAHTPTPRPHVVTTKALSEEDKGAMAISHFHPGVGQGLPTASPVKLWSWREEIRAVRGQHPSSAPCVPLGPLSAAPRTQRDVPQASTLSSRQPAL